MRATARALVLASVLVAASCGVDGGDGSPGADRPTGGPSTSSAPEAPTTTTAPPEREAQDASRDELIDVLQAAVVLMIPGVGRDTCLAEAALDGIGEDRVRAYVTAPGFQPLRDGLPLTDDEREVASRAVALAFDDCEAARSAFRDDFVTGAGGAALGAAGVECAIDELGEVVADGVVATAAGESFDGFALGRASGPRLFRACPSFGVDVIAAQLDAEGIEVDDDQRECLAAGLTDPDLPDEPSAAEIEALVARCT